METPGLPTISISIPKEILEYIDSRIQTAVAEAISGTSKEPKPQTRYLTRKETCKLLAISLPTLISYSQKGILHAFKIGNRVLYEAEAVTAALRDLPAKRR